MIGATPADMDADRHDVEGSFSEPLPEVDWDNIQIVETHDDKRRIELMTEDQVYVLLGLRDEETTKMAAPNGRRMDDHGGDNDGAALHVSDAIPDEMVITYDKDHPKMDLGTMYPSMKEFRMAVRQFAINEEFDLGTEKSDKTRFRGFYKSSEDCPWRILGSLQDDKSTVKSRGMVDRFRLRAKGGDGGNGCISLRRSRSDRQGKPDGGNGGRGGDVILECSRSIWDFSSLQHHMKASRGGHGVSKNQIGTRGSDKIAQVPVGTVIHLVQGEQPSLTVNKRSRSLDPWDILDAAEHSPAISNRIDSKMMKGLYSSLSSQQIAPKESTDGNEAGRGKTNTDHWEKQIYYKTCSMTEFSSNDGMTESYPQQVEMDEKDRFEYEDEEFWEDEDEFDMEEEAKQERQEQEVQYSVAEMTKPGQQLIIARGGEGGLGNACIGKDMWLCKANRQEEIALLSTGKPGTETFLILELKSIADVGLVGLPNAGKSTLLSALSRARPKIADYAFTTLRPNIGSLTYEDYFSVKVADIPGLIKGAHENRGLGHAFLRHIERTKVLAYVLDLAATLNSRKGVPPWEQLHDLVVELELYQEGLTKRPSLIVANKMDEEGADAMYKELKRRVQGVPIFPVCAILQEGVPDLRVGVRDLMDASDPEGIDLSKIIVN